MTYKVFNDLFEVTSSTLEKVFEYTNTTRSRLYINKFDLLPDLYFATQGEIIIKRNGIEVYKNNTGDQNRLNTYSQFPIRDTLPFLDRDETMIIEIRDRDLSTPEPQLIKLGISLELDFEYVPISSVLIPFSIEQLAAISKNIQLFEEKNYIETSTKKYFREFDIIGYRNLLFTINAISGSSPNLLSNSHTQPDLSTLLSDLGGGYLGNDSNLNKTGEFGEIRDLDSTMNFMYSDPSAAKFYNEANQEIIVEGNTGSFESDKAIFDMLNENKETRSYEFELLAADNFELDTSFSYVSSIARTYTQRSMPSGFEGRATTYYFQNLNYRYNLKGKRVLAVVTKTLTIDGSDSPDFEVFENLLTVEDLPDTKRTLELITNFKYVRFVITVNFTISVEEITPHFNLSWFSAGHNIGFVPIAYRDLELIYNALPNLGSEFLPNRVMAWFNTVFPEYVPNEVRNYLQSTKEISNTSLKLDFTKHIHANQAVIELKLGLQSKGTDEEWFDIKDDLGEISTTGKSKLELTEFAFDENIVIPRGQGNLRVVLDVLGTVKLSVLVTLS